MFAVVPLAVLAVIAVAIVSISGRRAPRGESSASPAHAVRRFFQYALLFGLLVIAAVGTSHLLGLALGSDALRTSGASGTEVDTYGLARDLTFAVVGLPLAGALGWWTRRSHRGDPSENASSVYATYVTGVALTSLVVAATSLQTLLAAALHHPTFEADAAARLLVWGPLWFLHWELSRRTVPPSLAVAHRVLGSTIGLVMVSSGFVTVVGTSLEMLVGSSGVIGRGAALAGGVGLFVAGSLVWVRYWALGASRDPRSALWFVHVLLVGVGGGLTLALVGASMLVWRVLVWFFGHPAQALASQHFVHAPTMFAMVLGGLILWWYHRGVLAGSGPVARGEVRRVYEYLMAAVALVAAAWGVAMLVAGSIETLTRSVGVGIGTDARNTLLAAITVLVVSVPVWVFYWRAIRSALDADPRAEVASRVRRIYLTLVIGVGLVAGVIALVATVLTLMQDVTASSLSGATLRSMRDGLGVFLAGAAVVAYHAAVWREDRALVTHTSPTTPEVPSSSEEGRTSDPGAAPDEDVRAVPDASGAPGRTIVLVGASRPGLAPAVAAGTGVRVVVWERPGAPDWDVQALIAAVSAHPFGDLLVLAEADGPRVIPVERGA